MGVFIFSKITFLLQFSSCHCCNPLSQQNQRCLQIEFASSSRLVRALSAICRNFSSSDRERGNSCFKWNLSRVGSPRSSFRNNSSITIVRWNASLIMLEIQLGPANLFVIRKKNHKISVRYAIQHLWCAFCLRINMKMYEFSQWCAYTYVCIYLRVGRSCWSVITRCFLFGGSSIESPLRSRGNLLWRQVCAVAIV